MSTVYIYPPLQVTVSTGSLATAAKQDEQTAVLTTIDADTGSISTSAASIDSKTPALGQATMANSSPVVIASDQSAVPVSGPLTDAELRATPVPISGTIAITATDLDIRDLSSASDSVTVVAANLDIRDLSSVSDSVAAAQSGAWSVAVNNFPATQPVSGTVAVTQSTSPWIVDGSAVTQPVSGPLTDAQLRATPVPISGTVATGGLTNAELRATAVPVSGPLTDAQLRATPVPTSLTSTTITGTVAVTQSTSPWIVDGSGVTQPVSGPLTDAQLRATPVPVSGTVSTGGLTDAQLRATAVPVSAASLPLPTGAATEATLLAFSNKTASSAVSEDFDYQAITYVTVGNGIGEIQTVVYKTGGAGGTTVATLTLAYDANNKLSSVTKT